MISKSYIVENDINLLNKNFVLFYGENLGLKDQFKENIRHKYKKIKIINYLQEEVIKNTSIFFNEIFNFSLFEEVKVIFINEANDKILTIIEEVQSKVDSQKIYVFSGILEKKSKLRNYFEKSDHSIAVPCYADNEISLKKIIMDKLKGYKGLSSQNLNIIIENCGLDRSKLNNELNKIATFFENKVIDTNKLETLLNLKVNDSFNLLKDQALIGDKNRTNKLISNTILENEKNIFYLNLINQRLMKLLEISKILKSGNLDDAISKIRPPIFWKDKAIFSLQARKWNRNKLSKILDQTYKIEMKIKSNSQIKQSLLIKKLLVDICCLANAS
ncbi:hypothetical protein OA669_00375 [Candidatus Pelagibacter bacterium]|nr:hypothetical protein [Candidatus Pelagibacter bacterium]